MAVCVYYLLVSLPGGPTNYDDVYKDVKETGFLPS